MNITDFYPDYLAVGFTKKTFGVNGKVRVHLESPYLPSIKNATHCFILVRGCLVPFFLVNNGEERVDGVFEFDWINSPEEAKEIVAKSIYLHKDQVENAVVVAGEKTFGFLEGYTLFDDDSELEIGVVEKVETYPEQEIASIKKLDDKVFLIPLNAESITGIDQEGMNLWMIIPEGIMDL